MDDKEPSPRELLAKAVDGLEPAERQKITAWLLERSYGARLAAPPFGIGTTIGREPGERLTESLGGSLRGEHQVVPIRLPTEQHAALRDWCQEHGFTMATVVRGLIERFLEEQTRT